MTPSAYVRHDYRADLDGLRAIAVVSVILYHLDPALAPGGFVGVDVFFVLSGFFITRQLAQDLKNGRFSLLGFYDRRIRRLFPALFTMLAVSTLVASVVLFPDDLKRFGATVAAAALSISNFLFWDESDYFAPTADSIPLLHTWSLAVEEQFYICFPIVLAVLWRYARPFVTPVLGLMAIVSFAVSAWGATAFQAATFYLLPTRAWELLLGSLLGLAAFPAPASAWQRNAAALTGLACIGTAIGLFSDAIPYPGLAAALPCLGSALLIWSGIPTPLAARDHAVARLLGLRPLVFVGLISYSLYLWHWPIIVFAKHISSEPPGPWGQAALIVVTFAASAVSWRFIELPFRHAKHVWPRPLSRAITTVAGTVVLCALGGLSYVTDGLQQILPKHIPQHISALAAQAKDFSPMRAVCHVRGNGETAFFDTCAFGPEHAPNVVVFADSHGTELSYALNEQIGQLMRVRQITASGCPPALDFTTKDRPRCNEHVVNMLDGLKGMPEATIIVTAFYAHWIGLNGSAFWRGFENVIERLRDAGHTVVILGDVPRHPYGRLPIALARWAQVGRPPETYDFPFDHTLARTIDARLRDLSRRAGATYVPLLEAVCQGTQRCHGFVRDHAIYFDDNHLSMATARWIVSDLLLPALDDRRPHQTSANR